MEKIWLLITLLIAWLLLSGCHSERMPEICDHYFDGCNRCTRNPDWTIVCTEKKCEIIEDHYCDESSYNEKYYQRLEEIERSVRNSPDYEEFMKDLDSLPDPEEEELDVEEIEEAYSGDEQLD